jgi:hypothetical protein
MQVERAPVVAMLAATHATAFPAPLAVAICAHTRRRAPRASISQAVRPRLHEQM